MTAPTPDPFAEQLAEALSWVSGDMTRYSESAHPDHNHWSWWGDGHGEAVRDEFRRQAADLMPLIESRVEAAKAEGRAEGLREARDEAPDDDVVPMVSLAPPMRFAVMVVCEICGNKRCPHATSADLACTGSNEPGQPGSAYENQGRAGEPCDSRFNGDRCERIAGHEGPHLWHVAHFDGTQWWDKDADPAETTTDEQIKED